MPDRRTHPTYRNDFTRTRDVALSLRASWPALSYRAIAEGLNVSHTFVSKVHAQMESGELDSEDFMRGSPTWTPTR